jgi:hypothetical protein
MPDGQLAPTKANPSHRDAASGYNGGQFPVRYCNQDSALESNYLRVSFAACISAIKFARCPFWLDPATGAASRITTSVPAGLGGGARSYRRSGTTTTGLVSPVEWLPAIERRFYFAAEGAGAGIGTMAPKHVFSGARPRPGAPALVIVACRSFLAGVTGLVYVTGG